MQAIIYKQYGNPEVLSLQDVDRPEPKANQVLVKLYATSLNASDVEFLHGKPAYTRFMGLFAPKKQILGSDISGIVEAIGTDVKQFKVGDAVMGDIFEHFGGFATYVCAPEKDLVLKLANLRFAQAAAIPQAALVALQGLRKSIPCTDKTLAGKRILINGGGGGAGSFAIQLAKFFDANVTAVDNSGKLDFMRKLGADLVIDYKQQDFATNGQAYDLILDFVGTRSASQVKRAINSNGRYVLVGGNIPTILSIMVMGFFSTIFSSKKIGLLAHKHSQADLKYIIERFNNGEVLPVITQTFPLAQTADAFAALISGKAKGKLVVIITPEPQSSPHPKQ